jgi:hypothetical protein
LSVFSASFFAIKSLRCFLIKNSVPYKVFITCYQPKFSPYFLKSWSINSLSGLITSIPSPSLVFLFLRVYLFTCTSFLSFHIHLLGFVFPFWTCSTAAWGLIRFLLDISFCSTAKETYEESLLRNWVLVSDSRPTSELSSLLFNIPNLISHLHQCLPFHKSLLEDPVGKVT